MEIIKYKTISYFWLEIFFQIGNQCNFSPFCYAPDLMFKILGTLSSSPMSLLVTLHLSLPLNSALISYGPWKRVPKYFHIFDSRTHTHSHTCTYTHTHTHAHMSYIVLLYYRPMSDFLLRSPQPLSPLTSCAMTLVKLEHSIWQEHYT